MENVKSGLQNIVDLSTDIFIQKQLCALKSLACKMFAKCCHFFLMVNLIKFTVFGPLFLFMLESFICWFLWHFNGKFRIRFGNTDFNTEINVTFRFIMRDLERLCGAWRLAVIYFGSGILGNAVSAIFVPHRAESGPSGTVLPTMPKYLQMSLISIYFQEATLEFLQLCLLKLSMLGLYWKVHSNKSENYVESSFSYFWLAFSLGWTILHTFSGSLVDSFWA